jgi:hypothetical protein
MPALGTLYGHWLPSNYIVKAYLFKEEVSN